MTDKDTAGKLLEGLTDTEIIHAVSVNGGVEPAARFLGIAGTTLRRGIRQRGLLDQVNAARMQTRNEDYARRKLEFEKETAALENQDDGPSREDVLEQESKELKAEVRRLRETQTFDHRVVNALEGAVSAVQPSYSPNVIPKRSSDEEGEHEFVLLFSDTHAGEVVNPEETLNMNEYSWDTMLKRMAKIQSSVFSYQENRPYQVRKLHILMLGDMLSGDIHQELSETNDRPMAEATIQFGADASVWMEEFVPHFELINVVGVPGNHPRAKVKPQAKQAHNNADWVAYKFMESKLSKYDCFSFNFPRAAFAVETVAERWRLLLMHGDGIRSTMPGVPWGGVVRRITALQQQFAYAAQPIDYVTMGHFHQRASLEGVGVDTILNGSVKGIDEYSLKQFGSGRPPAQYLLTFHPKRGLTDTSRIDLQDVITPAMEKLA